MKRVSFVIIVAMSLATVASASYLRNNLTIAGSIDLANSEQIANAVDGKLSFAGVGWANNESLILDFETVANTIVWTSSSGVVGWNLGASGALLTLGNGVSINTGTNEKITFKDTEDLTFDFTGSNEVNVTSSTSVNRVDFGTIAVKTTIPLMMLGAQYFCGQGANATTASYIGPAMHTVAADTTTYDFGEAGCDGLDSTTETTADRPLQFGSPFSVVGMRCYHAAGGTDDVYTFQLRDDAADVTGVTCNVTLDTTDNYCSVILDVPVAVAAGSALAVKEVASTDDNMSAIDTECIVFYTF